MLPESIKSIVLNKKGPLDREELIMGESIKALEFAIYAELKECLKKAKTEKGKEEHGLTRTIVELQCALDIVQSAKTKEETRRVYEILKCLREP